MIRIYNVIILIIITFNIQAQVAYSENLPNKNDGYLLELTTANNCGLGLTSYIFIHNDIMNIEKYNFRYTFKPGTYTIENVIHYLEFPGLGYNIDFGYLTITTIIDSSNKYSHTIRYLSYSNNMEFYRLFVRNFNNLEYVKLLKDIDVK